MSNANPFPTTIPETTRAIGLAILDPNDLCRFLGENVEELFPESLFQDLYADEGRPSVSPVILAIVSVLQFLEDLPDRQACQQVIKRLDWKYALRQELTWLGFHPTDLCRFRQRLVATNAIDRIFDQILGWLKAHEYIKKRELQRTDSTHLLAQVARLSRIELMADAVRLALVELISIDSKWVWERLGQVAVQPHLVLPTSFKRSRTQLAQWEQELVEFANTLLTTILQQGHQEWRQLPAITLLYNILTQQQVCLAPEIVAIWDALVLPPAGNIESPHDPEARYSQKRGQGWVGYKTHLTETVDAKGSNFITDVWVTYATQHDSGAVEGIQQRLIQRGLCPERQYVDRAYISAELIAKSQQRGIDLRGEVQTAASKKVEGFRLQDFRVDMTAQQAICPMGKTSVRWSSVNGTKNVDYRAFFGPQCRECPYFANQQCTDLPSGRRLDINEYHDVLQARRQEQKSALFQREMNRRVGIESTISESVRGHGLRQNRYRGLAKTQLQATFTATAMNLKRLTHEYIAA
jgi:transposase